MKEKVEANRMERNSCTSTLYHSKHIWSEHVWHCLFAPQSEVGMQKCTALDISKLFQSFWHCYFCRFFLYFYSIVISVQCFQSNNLHISMQKDRLRTVHYFHQYILHNILQTMPFSHVMNFKGITRKELQDWYNYSRNTLTCTCKRSITEV